MLFATVLQQDNARPMQHAASHSSSPTATSKILPWLSMSPDLTPNKHTWNELERRVRGRVNAPANVRQLFQALKQESLAIPAQVIYNLIQSVPERCWTVIGSREGHTPFWCACKNQMQNEIWWTWVLVEFSNNNSVWKRPKYAFLLLLFSRVINFPIIDLTRVNDQSAVVPVFDLTWVYGRSA